MSSIIYEAFTALEAALNDFYEALASRLEAEKKVSLQKALEALRKEITHE